VADEDIRKLAQAIEDYAKWVKGTSKTTSYPQTLMDFLLFAINNGMAWKDMFTVDTLEAFRSHSRFTVAPRALVSLSDYLFSQNRIDQPLEIPTPQILKHVVQLPDLYEQYLLFYKQTSRVSDDYLKSVRSLLARFHEYLQKQNIEIPVLKIEHIDTFLGGIKGALSTHSLYRSQLRGFLRYLYHERKIIKRDLADLLVGPPIFAKPKPPKFLRPNELQKLFSSLTLSTPRSIRTYAMVHLAYTMALRPVEISRIILNDISFSEKTLTMQKRKGDRPITLPIPEKTMKAIAVYILHVRIKTQHRHLFMTHKRPYCPLSSGSVCVEIWRAMKNAGLSSSAYWLRHTHAQNLLLLGRSIYEIKEMLGHQDIQHTQRYLHIDTELMRKVLLNETL
jgi:site-specific recombinase XerD